MTGEVSPLESGDEVAARGTLRASHEDRDQVVELLRVAAGDGRLTADELDERLEAALTARTVGELAALTADLPADATSAPVSRPKDLTRIECRSAHVRRDGRWVVPRRIEVQVMSGQVTLDFTEAVVAVPSLQIDAEVSSGQLTLVTKPGIVVEADDVSVRSGHVTVRQPPSPAVPVTLRIQVSGKVGSGRITARPPRRTFWQWLLRHPGPYAITSR